MRAAASFFSAWTLATALQAQTTALECGSTLDSHDTELNELVEGHVLLLKPQVEAYRAGGPCSVHYRIPVVFHIVADPSVPLSNVSDADILAQLAALNAEYNGNVDELGEDPCIEFCLAQNTPNGEDWLADFGSTTPGITRWSNAALSNNDMSSASMEAMATLVHFPPARYLNIWIVNSLTDDGPGGIAGFGISSISWVPVEGVLIEHVAITNYMGVIAGKLLIHEVGHCLGLLHTFQGGCDTYYSDCTKDGDRCCDTPPQASSNIDAVGCIDVSDMSCGVPEDLDNYMDYLPEDCQWVFTADQVVRMHAHILAWRASLVDPANHNITGIAGPAGCTSTEVTSTFYSNTTQFCTNITAGQVNGTFIADSWTFTFTDPNGAIAYTTSGVSTQPSATYTFNAPGSWTITLSNVTLDGISADPFTMTVWVTDCAPVDNSQAKWYFGGYCSLDFTTGVPVATDNSAMQVEDQPANASSAASGTIEFYGSSKDVYNSGHQFLGTAQGRSYGNAVAVPNPGNPAQYYMFYTPDRTDTQQEQELHYFVVDMSLTTGGSPGGIAPGGENVSVGAGEPLVSKHLGAVPHCNGTDYWIVTHDFDLAGGASQLLSYRLTANGISGPAIVSPAFAVGGEDGKASGEIEFNHDGDLAAITSPENWTCYIYAFDRETGLFEWLFNLPVYSNTKAVAFSRSGDFLYTTRAGIPGNFLGYLYQHDMRNIDRCDPQPPPYNALEFPRYTAYNGLQLGPDDKIYMTNDYTDSVSVINYPEVWNDFGFFWRGVSVVVPGGTDETCRIGLPNMIDARPGPAVNDFYACVECNQATFYLTGCASSVEWDIDCNGGTPDGTGVTFTYTFPPGTSTYCVTMLAGGQTVQHQIDIASMALSANTVPACNGASNGAVQLTVDGGTGAFVCSWTGPNSYTSTEEDLTDLEAGDYSVTVTDANGCMTSATFTVPASVVAADAVITPAQCANGIGGTIDLDVQSGQEPFDFLWSNGATTEDISELEAGTYSITITDDNGCEFQGELIVPEIAPCCEADLMITDGTLSSTLPPMITGTVNIQGEFIVNDNTAIYDAQITMGPGAEITVLDGVTLDMEGSTVESCADMMWKSITVRKGAEAYIFGSAIHDGERAIDMAHGSTVVTQGVLFQDNRTGIYMPFNDPGLPTTLVVRECVFYGNATMKDPYPGQTNAVGDYPYAGIDVSEFQLDLTESGNSFQFLSNGIVGWRSDIYVSNCTFLGIQPDPAYAGAFNGSAIYGRGSHGIYNIKQTGFGDSGTESFSSCRWGIYAEYMNVRSTDNNMYNMGTAYRVMHGYAADIDLLDNLLETKYDGIQLLFNGGAHHLLVQNNNLTFAVGPPPGTQSVWAGIRVSEQNNKNLDSRILDNDIHYHTFVSDANCGIEMRTANNYQISDNELFMHDNAVNLAGIRLSGCEHTLVSCNNVHGSYSAYGVDLGQSAIRINMSANSTISCNTVDGTTNGIFFTGGCYNTDLRGNSFHEHLWALHLDGNAIIDDQDVKGNLWYPNTLTGHIDAWHEGLPAVVLLSPVRVNPALVDLATTSPASILPADWFIPSSDPNFLCDEGETNYCDLQIRMGCPDCKTRLDERIAGDELENEPYTEETKWMMRGELLEKLDQSPALLNEEQDLADFYAEMENTSVNQYKTISDENLALFNLDTTISAYLAQNRAQVDYLMPQLKAALDALADPDLNEAQRQAHLSTAAGLQASIASLLSLNEQALDLAANSRVLTAEGLRATNADIGANAQIEVNEKIVNDIYLNTLAQDVDVLTTSEAMDLFDVANQCPLVGGIAVYRARALYELVDIEQDYDDPSLCLAHGIVVRNLAETEQRTVRLMPNPARDVANLVYQLKEGSHGELLVHDALGRLVLREGLNYEQQRHTFSILQLAPGAFHYVVLENGGFLGEGKFTVVR